jgi:F-box protein 9
MACLFRPFVKAVYKPPQIPDSEAVDDILGLYDADYRRTWIEHPRVRLDGVYIAVNQYMCVSYDTRIASLRLMRAYGSRPGLSENLWVNVRERSPFVLNDVAA